MSDNNTTVLSLEPGDSLSGRYRLEKVIGEGGMAVVWMATDLNLDRPVAIKVLPTALSRDTRSITRLKAEANRNLDLTHANIVRLYSFEQDPVRGNQAFLVMQYVEGRTLHELLAEHPNGLPKKQLQKWSAQIASAVDFAHKRGVLHRDIKPSNIIIEEATGMAFLMDFGIARETRDTMTMMTGRQESSGTLPYMSPQQLVGKNHKSNDIYSFTATLYEAFCGHPPFRTGDIAYQIREIDAEPIESLSKTANAALLAGLAKDADKRPETCMAILRVSIAQKEAATAIGGDDKAEGKATAKGFEAVEADASVNGTVEGALFEVNPIRPNDKLAIAKLAEFGIGIAKNGLTEDGNLLPIASLDFWITKRFNPASIFSYAVLIGMVFLATAVMSLLGDVLAADSFSVSATFEFYLQNNGSISRVIHGLTIMCLAPAVDVMNETQGALEIKTIVMSYSGANGDQIEHVWEFANQFESTFVENYLVRIYPDNWSL